VRGIGAGFLVRRCGGRFERFGGQRTVRGSRVRGCEGMVRGSWFGGAGVGSNGSGATNGSEGSTARTVGRLGSSDRAQRLGEFGQLGSSDRAHRARVVRTFRKSGVLRGLGGDSMSLEQRQPQASDCARRERSPGGLDGCGPAGAGRTRLRPRVSGALFRFHRSEGGKPHLREARTSNQEPPNHSFAPPNLRTSEPYGSYFRYQCPAIPTRVPPSSNVLNDDSSQW
jgi:hypothetical protein